VLPEGLSFDGSLGLRLFVVAGQHEVGMHGAFPNWRRGRRGRGHSGAVGAAAGGRRLDVIGLREVRTAVNNFIALMSYLLLHERLVVLPPAASHARSAAGGQRAKEYPQQGEKDACGHQRGPDELQLRRLEALVAEAHEGDDESHGGHAQAHVEDHVGGGGGAVDAILAVQLVDLRGERRI